MEIKKETLPQSKIKLTIKVSSPEMRRFFSRVYNKLAPQAEVKGFRPGMAPRSMVISAIGENRLNSEIVDLALNETYAAVLKKEQIIPVAPPKINIKMLKDLTVDTAELEYEAEVDILPKIKVGNYKEIKIRKGHKEIKAAKNEVEQVLSHLQRQSAQFKDIDRPVKIGDRLEINFEGSERGVKLENLSSKNYPIILGSKVLLPEFEEKLVGLKKGDKKEFTVHMAPKQEDQAKGKKNPIEFKVEVLSTQEVILPPLDDKLAKKFQKDTIEELKEAIKQDVIKQKEIQQKKETENDVLEGLLKISQIDLPESLIEQEVERRLEDIRKRASTAGLTLEKYLENIKKTLEDFKKDLKPQAEKTVKIGLALGEIARLEGIDTQKKEAAGEVIEKLLKYATK